MISSSLIYILHTFSQNLDVLTIYAPPKEIDSINESGDSADEDEEEEEEEDDSNDEELASIASHHSDANGSGDMLPQSNHHTTNETVEEKCVEIPKALYLMKNTDPIYNDCKWTNGSSLLMFGELTGFEFAGLFSALLLLFFNSICIHLSLFSVTFFVL